MKQILLLALVSLTIGVLNAQITLTQSNVSHSSSYNDVRHIDASGITVPIHGSAVVYNYASLSGATVDTIPYMPATRTGFTGFTRFNWGAALLGGIPLYSEYYTHMDATGVARVGSYKLEQHVGLGSITGSNSDSLHFPGNNTIFAQPNYDIKFPCTYGDQWSSNYIYHTDFLITVGLFGLNKTPGSRVQYAFQTDSVVGYGTLTLPTDNGPSAAYEVLVIKRSRVYIDSTFLNGSPAPPSLLAAFGLTQGDTIRTNQYVFYAAGFERPLLTIDMSTDWTTPTRSIYGSVGVYPLGITTKGFSSNLNIYPNPVEPSGTIRIDISDIAPRSILQVYNTIGQLIYSATISDNGQGTMDWSVPTDLNAGTYFLSLHDPLGKPVSTGKLLIK